MRHFNQHQHYIDCFRTLVRHSTWQGGITMVKTGKSWEKVFAPAGNLNFKICQVPRMNQSYMNIFQFITISNIPYGSPQTKMLVTC